VGGNAPCLVLCRLRTHGITGVPRRTAPPIQPILLRENGPEPASVPPGLWGALSIAWAYITTYNRDHINGSGHEISWIKPQACHPTAGVDEVPPPHLSTAPGGRSLEYICVCAMAFPGKLAFLTDTGLGVNKAPSAPSERIHHDHSSWYHSGHSAGQNPFSGDRGRKNSRALPRRSSKRSARR